MKEFFLKKNAEDEDTGKKFEKKIANGRRRELKGNVRCFGGGGCSQGQPIAPPAVCYHVSTLPPAGILFFHFFSS
jgi:hypothetical protein